MKNLILIVFAIFSLSIFANEIECQNIHIQNNDKDFHIGFRTYFTGSETQETGLKEESKLLTSLDQTYLAEGLLKKQDYRKLDAQPLRVINVSKIEMLYSEADIDLEVTLELPVDIADEYNDGVNQVTTICQEFISCDGLDC